MLDTLSKHQLKSLSDTLSARKKVLSELIHIELSSTGNSEHSKLAGLVHDTKDESWINALSTVDEAVVELHLAELQDIRDAEQRMANDVFGRCLDCETDIGFTRLTAYPTAKRCISCQQMYEEQGVRQQA